MARREYPAAAKPQNQTRKPGTDKTATAGAKLPSLLLVSDAASRGKTPPVLLWQYRRQHRPETGVFLPSSTAQKRKARPGRTIARARTSSLCCPGSVADTQQATQARLSARRNRARFRS